LIYSFELRFGKIAFLGDWLSILNVVLVEVFKMGKLFSRIFDDREMQILIIGLRGAGKSTILEKLKLSPSIETDSSADIEIETVSFRNIDIKAWNVGSQDKSRLLWRQYFNEKTYFVFVIDCNDRDRIEESKQELHRVLNDQEIKTSSILIFANKQDLPKSMKPNELEVNLDLPSSNDKECVVQPLSAIFGDGLFEGLTWLADR